MKNCNIQEMNITTMLNGAIHSENKVVVIDFRDNHWVIRHGDFGGQYEARCTTQDIEDLAALLSAMLISQEEEEALESGDANTPWKDED